MALRISHVYFAREVGTPHRFKIGHAVQVPRRVSQLQSGNPRRIEVYRTMLHIRAPELERALHIKYRYSRVHREWFDLHQETVDFEYARRNTPSLLARVMSEATLVSVAGLSYQHINRLVELNASDEIASLAADAARGVGTAAIRRRADQLLYDRTPL